MNPALLAAAFAAIATSLSAQVVEIPAMTVTTSTINMSTLNPGNTTLAAVINAGSNGGAPIAALTLAPSLAAAGIYNRNPELGRALARSSTGGLAIVSPLDTFLAFDATIDLTVPGTEFGIAIGDWAGGLLIEFRNRTTNALLASHASSLYESADAKFYRSPVPFDRLVIRADNLDGNWVIPQLHLQTESPWDPIGSGCPGTNGTPVLSLVAPPRINTTFSLRVSNMQPTGGGYLMVLGTSTTTASFGTLPFALDVLGAPGCVLYTDLLAYTILFHTNGTGQYDLAIPNNPLFIGIPVSNQAVVADAGINALGGVVSNAGVGIVR